MVAGGSLTPSLESRDLGFTGWSSHGQQTQGCCAKPRPVCDRASRRGVIASGQGHILVVRDGVDPSTSGFSDQHSPPATTL